MTAWRPQNGGRHVVSLESAQGVERLLLIVSL